MQWIEQKTINFSWPESGITSKAKYNSLLYLNSVFIIWNSLWQLSKCILVNVKNIVSIYKVFCVKMLFCDLVQSKILSSYNEVLSSNNMVAL